MKNTGSNKEDKKGGRSLKYIVLGIIAAIILFLLARCLYLKNKNNGDNGGFGPVVLYGPPPTSAPVR